MTLEPEELPPPPALRQVLRIVKSGDESAEGRELPLDGSTWTLGRASSGLCQINDPRVSSEHVIIRPTIEGYRIEDVGRHGTMLNGEKLDGDTPFKAGDVLAFGDTLAVFDREPDPDLLPAAPTTDPNLASAYNGVSLAAQRIRMALATAATRRSPVLLRGRTGVGKEVAAQEIARLSGLKSVAVNVTAIPADRVEAELFGWVRGAFTGALGDHDGFFVQASGGILFLDEIGDLALEVQSKLLRALDDGSIQPLGQSKPARVNVRVIAATNRDLQPPAFREDLLARLNKLELHLPTLAERRADILPLWEHTLRQQGYPRIPCSAAFAEALLIHDWEYNTREIQRVAEQVLGTNHGVTRFDLNHLPKHLANRIRDRRVRQKTPTQDLEPEAEMLILSLKKNNGNLAAVGRELKLPHREQIRRLLQRYNLDPDSFRSKV